MKCCALWPESFKNVAHDGVLECFNSLSALPTTNVFDDDGKDVFQDHRHLRPADGRIPCRMRDEFLRACGEQAPDYDGRFRIRLPWRTAEGCRISRAGQHHGAGAFESRSQGSRRLGARLSRNKQQLPYGSQRHYCLGHRSSVTALSIAALLLDHRRFAVFNKRLAPVESSLSTRCTSIERRMDTLHEDLRSLIRRVNAVATDVPLIKGKLSR